VQGTKLTPIRDAFEGLTDIKLQALIVATNEAPRIAYSLLLWIGGARDWEINRRGGRHYELQGRSALWASRELGPFEMVCRR
jgi:hypothetical protein